MRVERVTTLLYNEVVTLFLGGERMLQFEHIAKSYKTKQILRDINLTIPKGLCGNHWRKRMWKNHFAENDKPID